MRAFAERVAREVAALPVARRSRAGALRAELDGHSFAAPRAAADVLADVEALLRRHAVHVTHPRYFGLFNPSVPPTAVAAAALCAAYNVQEAVWAHAPGAVEMERRVLRFLAGRIGWDADASDAHFTSGGQESNLTAVVVALVQAFPDVREHGVRALPSQPVLYASDEAHDSLVRAAQVTGLGRAAVRRVALDAARRLDVAVLRELVTADRAAGRAPFLVVGTLGTTAAGAIDPLPEIADLCAGEGLWFHCDAAWGGGVLLSDRLAPLARGVERADSVTWDAHKWLSMPMGSGMWFCRRREAVAAAFELHSAYMPRGGATDDPHARSLQWSRRAIGVPLFAVLDELGAAGLAALVEHQTELGRRLRELLAAAGFALLNSTPLPLVCFSHPRIASGEVAAGAVARRVVASGRAWLSAVRLGASGTALRACVTSYRTGDDDLRALVDAARAAVEAEAARKGPGKESSSSKE